MEIIYPTRIILDSKGLIQDIELIKNCSQISSEMDKLKYFFEDPFSSDYIEKMKKIIESPKQVSEKFKNTLLNSFLFNSVYSQKLSSTEENRLYIRFYPWVENVNPILFEIHNSISDVENSDEKFIKIQQKGISIDYRTYEELYYKEFQNDELPISENKSIDCEFDTEYTIKKENKSLQRIEATFQNFVEENIEKETFLLERLI